MIDESVVVNMLVLVGNHESVDVALSALTAESELQAVARHAVVQIKYVSIIKRISWHTM